MRQRKMWVWSPAGAAIVALVAAGWILGHGDAFAKRSTRQPSVKGTLKATAVDPAADGNFEENVEDGLPDGSGPIGELKVNARKLAPKAAFGVNVGGVSIGTLKTNRVGTGRAKFSTSPRGRTQPLPVDPRGKKISLTNGTDDEVLEGEISDPTTPGGIQCCLNSHDQSGDQQGCDSLLPAECTAANGIDMGPGTCEPDPCPGAGDSASGAETGETADGPDEGNGTGTNGGGN